MPRRERLQQARGHIFLCPWQAALLTVGRVRAFKARTGPHGASVGTSAGLATPLLGWGARAALTPVLFCLRLPVWAAACSYRVARTQELGARRAKVVGCKRELGNAWSQAPSLGVVTKYVVKCMVGLEFSTQTYYEVFWVVFCCRPTKRMLCLAQGLALTKGTGNG